MRLRMPGWRGTLGTLAVLALAAGVTYGALALAGVGGGQEQAPAVDLVPGILRTSNRDHLAICVRGVGVSPAEEAAVTAAVEAALPKLAENPAWWKAAAGLPPPTVDNDCAARPLLYAPEFASVGEAWTHPGWVVSLPDVHAVMVFVVAPGEIERLGFNDAAWIQAGQKPNRQHPQENVCMGDMCFGATMGIYLTAEDAKDTDFLVVLLARAIGLGEAYK